MNMIKQKKILRVCLLTISFILSCFFYWTDSFPYWSITLYIASSSTFIASFLSWKKIKKTTNYLRYDLVIAVALGAIAFTLYTYRIAEITPGLWGDEVALGWMAEQLMHRSSFTPFLAYNLGHPTPLIYLSSLFITLLGRTVLALRLSSIFFGSLTVSVFYLFLRYHFKRLLSSSGAIVLMTSYMFVTVTRFAYEMSAAAFFFICTALGVAMISKKITSTRLAFLGTTLGLGLHTYLAFRTVALVYLLFSVLIILKEKNRWKSLALILVTLTLISLPLSVYSLRHPRDVNERVFSLSVFHQNLPTDEVVKELRGATYWTMRMFFNTGDPNWRQNPANTTPIDLVSSVLFFAGLAYLFFHNKKIFVPTLTLILTILATSIITLEQHSQFYYYGVGHPNTLRISLLAPIVSFCIVWILNFFSTKFPKKIWPIVLLGITVLIVGININRYYNQKITQWIYTTNFVVPMNVIALLNNELPPEAALTKSLYNTQHVQYFLAQKVSLKKIADPLDCTFANLPSNYVVLSADDLQFCAKDDILALVRNSQFQITLLYSPWKTVDAIVVRKR
jgi:hypothetical protein